MTNRFVSPQQQFISNIGLPYAGGSLYFYVSGTQTPANTYQDVALTTPNSNPVILDSAGDAGNIFLDSTITYKVVLNDASGDQIWTFDPIIPVDGSGSSVNSIIPCSASGLNTITLTPLISAQQPTAYSNYQVFAFVPSVSSTGPVTIQVGALGALNLYVTPGAQATSGTIVAGQGPYFIAYGSVVAGSSPGFLMINLGDNPGAGLGTSASGQLIATSGGVVVAASGDTTGAKDTAAIQAAINSTSTGIVWLNGTDFYVLGGDITLTGKSGMHIRGGGRQATTVHNVGSSGYTFNFTGACQHCSISDLTISGTPSAPPTSGFAITFQGNCFECEARNILIVYMFNGILIQSSTETKLDTIRIRPIAGTSGILYVGSSSIPCFRAVIDDLACDNYWPGSSSVDPSNIVNWAASTNFTAGKIVSVNNGIYICITPGTSGSSGPTGTNFASTVADGSVAWQFVCNSSLAWITMASYAYSLVLSKVALIDGVTGILMEDSAGGGYGVSAPQWIEGFDIELDHNFSVGLYLAGGAGVDMVDVWVSSTLNGNGILVQTGFSGEFMISNARIFGCWQHGALVQCPNLYGGFVNCRAGANGLQSPGSGFNGFTFADACSKFMISNCYSGEMNSLAATQSYGIEVNAGASDHYTITNNVCFGNNSGGVGDGGTGSNKTVTGNVT